MDVPKKTLKPKSDVILTKTAKKYENENVLSDAQQDVTARILGKENQFDFDGDGVPDGAESERRVGEMLNPAAEQFIGGKYVEPATDIAYNEMVCKIADAWSSRFGVEGQMDKEDVRKSLDNLFAMSHSGILDYSDRHITPYRVRAIDYAMQCDAYTGQENWSIGQQVAFNYMVSRDVYERKFSAETLAPYNRNIMRTTLDVMNEVDEKCNTDFYSEYASRVNSLDDEAERIREKYANDHFKVTWGKTFRFAEKEPAIAATISAEATQKYLSEKNRIPLSMDEARDRKIMERNSRYMTPEEANAMLPESERKKALGRASQVRVTEDTVESPELNNNMQFE